MHLVETGERVAFPGCVADGESRRDPEGSEHHDQARADLLAEALAAHEQELVDGVGACGERGNVQRVFGVGGHPLFECPHLVVTRRRARGDRRREDTDTLGDGRQLKVTGGDRVRARPEERVRLPKPVGGHRGAPADDRVDSALLQLHARADRSVRELEHAPVGEVELGRDVGAEDEVGPGSGHVEGLHELLGACVDRVVRSDGQLERCRSPYRPRAFGTRRPAASVPVVERLSPPAVRRRRAHAHDEGVVRTTAYRGVEAGREAEVTEGCAPVRAAATARRTSGVAGAE